MIRTVLAALALLLLVAAPAQAQPALGEASGDASAGGNGEVSAGVTVGESLPGYPGGGPGGSGSTQRTGGTNLVTYGWRGPLPGSGCPGLGAELPGLTAPPDDLYEYVRYDRTAEPPTTTVLSTTCFPPEAPPRLAPPPPPAPPTMAEITALARNQVFAPTVGVSPPGEGLTGLETWFWYEGQQQVAVSASVRGYTVDASMTPTRFYWHTGESLLGSPLPGSPTAPAARWTYEAKNPYRIHLQVVWDGTWTFTGWDASASGNLATIRATGARDYVVNEVRSVLSG